MALPIRPTPTLNVRESKRFMELIEEGLKNPTGMVPTPKLEKARLLVLEHARNYELQNTQGQTAGVHREQGV